MLQDNYFATSTMKLTSAIIIIISFVYMTGCRPASKITSKDTSTETHSKKAARKDVKFIDGIEVTPGNAVTSKHKTATGKHQTGIDSANHTNTDAQANIEKPDWLQLKYAVMMDASVEKVSNVSLLQKLEEWWGTRYCMGGNTKNCIDCSAFTMNILGEVYHVKLPRTAQEQYNMSDKIATEELKEGDLVFFHTNGKKSKVISHVGVYITNNRFANASTTGGVTISDLNDPYWKNRYTGAGRVIK